LSQSIGFGGQSRVFLASRKQNYQNDQLDDNFYAFKIFKSQDYYKNAYLALTAIEKMKKVTKNVSVSHIVFNSNKYAVLVTPFYSRLDINTRLSVIEIFPEIVRFLFQVHQLGWIHGDITPDNLLLDSNSNIYVNDWASAFNINEKQELVSKHPMFFPHNVKYTDAKSIDLLMVLRTWWFTYYMKRKDRDKLHEGVTEIWYQYATFNNLQKYAIANSYDLLYESMKKS